MKGEKKSGSKEKLNGLPDHNKKSNIEKQQGTHFKGDEKPNYPLGK